ncbi:MAG: glycosyltransferase family 4 protein [Candidatus Marinamargulisbacteria bacterium]
MKKLKIHVIAEEFVGEANGVTTAILELIESLKHDPFYELVDTIADADVIHAHTIGLDYIKQSFKYKQKMVVSAHVIPDSFLGSLIFSRLWRPLAKAYLTFVYNRSKEVVAVSPFVKLELEKINVQSKIHVLCNSVDRSKFKQNETLRSTFRKKHQLTNEFVVTCVGQIQPRKGIYDFIDTAKKCPDITFVWVGGTPFKGLTAEYKKLQEVVKAAPKNIRFLGIVDFKDMPAYYAMSDVFFMPSYQENFAFATIEASAVKLPLLLRDNVEYPSSLFTHYLKGSHANDFATIVTKLKNDPDFLCHWQQESDTLANKYALDAYMAQLKQIYLGVVGQNT